MFRIQTKNALVDVTSDHSLLNKYGKEITPQQCIVNNTELLHNKCPKHEYKQYAKSIGIWDAILGIIVPIILLLQVFRFFLLGCT